MKAGILKEKVAIYKLIEVKTEFGNNAREWVLHVNTRAGILHRRGGILNLNSELVHSFSKEFVLRSYIDIDENMRIKYKDRLYRILDIDENKEMNDIVVTAEVINE